ncbi:RING finger protein 212B isoform X6 [Struthio camelus]|uniref:RING finger protein 212B isoform X6 n=1 Tax=Struthio camelus TaxID=8801 RepID=UPI0036042A2A
MSAPGTDWFHCNRCFRQEGAQFSVTSCGHVLCRQCAGAAGKCPVCGAACKSLRLSDEMRPQEKLFFESPAAVALKRLARVSQAWRFQRAQTDLLLAFREDEARRARAALQETRQALAARHRELEALRRENGELRQHLRALQVSPGWRPGSRTATPRPVGVTSPAQTVTPQPRRQLSGQVVRLASPAGGPAPPCSPALLAPPWAETEPRPCSCASPLAERRGAGAGRRRPARQHAASPLRHALNQHGAAALLPPPAPLRHALNRSMRRHLPAAHAPRGPARAQNGGGALLKGRRAAAAPS